MLTPLATGAELEMVTASDTALPLSVPSDGVTLHLTVSPFTKPLPRVLELPEFTPLINHL